MNPPRTANNTPNAPSDEPHPTQAFLRDADALVFVEDLDHPHLRSDDAHHLRTVLRLAPGSLVVAADGSGTFRACRLRAGSTRRSSPREPGAPIDPDDLEIDGPTMTAVGHRPVRVGFSLVKGDRNDWAVQKLTELGVDRITPILAERSVVRLDDATRSARGERFRRIAREAASQARRTALPIVDDPAPFSDLGFDLATTALAEPGGGEWPATLDTVLVGPEGGWSPAELEYGLAQVDLGPTILRAETAAIAVGVRLTAGRHDDVAG